MLTPRIVNAYNGLQGFMVYPVIGLSAQDGLHFLIVRFNDNERPPFTAIRLSIFHLRAAVRAFIWPVWRITRLNGLKLIVAPCADAVLLA